MEEWSDTQAKTMAEVGHAPAAHGGAPHLNPDSYASQLFWLAVTFVALYLLVARSILPRIHEVLEKRQHHLNQDLDRAEAFSAEAEEARNAYEKLQADARGKAQQVIAETQASVAALQEKKFTEVDADLQRRLIQSRTDMASRVEALQGTLEPVAKEVAALLVDKLIGMKPRGEVSVKSGAGGQGDETKKRQAG